MNKILIQFAHPARARSKINNALRQAVEGLEQITVNDLYAQYPDFYIDVAREQALCEAHDIIIFQHPFYWYSTPAIMKEWLDLVLKHGWAFGYEGSALAGKYVFQAITGGGDADTYQKDGYNGFTIAEFTAPFQATAKLCGMHWLPPFTVLGTHRGLSTDKVDNFATDYRRCLLALRDGRIDFSRIDPERYLNSDLNQIIREAQ